MGGDQGVFHLLWGLFMLFVSSVPGFVLMVAIAEMIPESLHRFAGFMPLASVVIFSPFCFLGGQLNESQFNPISVELLKGIPEHIGFWLRYYLISIVGIVMIIAGFMLSFQAVMKLDIPQDSHVWGIVTGFMIAFFFSIGIFFYFRLLGRLARAIEMQNYETYEPGEKFEFNEDYY